MSELSKKALIILALIFVFAAPAQATNITSCTTISAPGTYNLTGNIIASATAKCIDIAARDVELNCLGNTIEGASAYNSVGIRVTKDNVNITNCTVKNWYTGIEKEGSNYGLISNSVLASNSRGLILKNSEGNSIFRSMIKSNSIGVVISFSEFNVFYNNLFNNTNNTQFTGATTNRWNITKQKGERIYSTGGYIGGNYWSNPQGGYSDLCLDSNKDGFCDEAYKMDLNNLDYSALSNEYVVDTTPPTIRIESPKSDSILDSTMIAVNITADDLVYSHTNVSISQGENITASNMTFQKGNFVVLIKAPQRGYLNITATAYDLEGNSKSAEVKNILTPLSLGYCQDLSVKGEMYVLENDIGFYGGSICLNIQADDITLDCQNRSITGNEATYKTYGVSFNGRRNITIRNCMISGWTYGIFGQSAQESTITRCFISRNRDSGIYLYQSTGNRIRETIIANNSACGLRLYSSADNWFYNNMFQNPADVIFEGEKYKNYWNIDKKNGTRIHSRGREIGGNYWGGGALSYSELCDDNDTDGFCDEPYDIEAASEKTNKSMVAGFIEWLTGSFLLAASFSSNTDYLPLSDNFAPDTTPPVTNITVTLPNGATQNLSEWVRQYDHVRISFNCSDGYGSGCKRTFYCYSKAENCTLSETYRDSFRIDFDKNQTEVIYFRFFSTDKDNNNETLKNASIKSLSSSQRLVIDNLQNNQFINSRNITVSVNILRPSEHNYTEINVYNSRGELVNQTTSSSNWTISFPVYLTEEGKYRIDAIFNSLYGFSGVESTVNFTLDMTPPAITAFSINPQKASIGDNISATCTASDSMKGTFNGEITGIITNAKGKRNATCTAADDAGNTASRALEYEVLEIQCSEGSKRCSGSSLQSCKNYEWVSEACEYGCDPKSLTCKPKPEEPENRENETGKNQTGGDDGEEGINPIMLAAGAFLFLLIIVVMIVIYTKVFRKPKEDFNRRLAILEAKINEAEAKGKDVSKVKAELELAQQDLNMGLVEMAEPRIKNVEKELKNLR